MHTARIASFSRILGVAVLSGCCSKGPALAVGAEVEAPRADGTFVTGEITELYGKLAEVRFDGGEREWILVVDLEPPGVPAPDPSDACSIQVGQRVLAPWSKTKKAYLGRMSETHGKLGEVTFDDGDKTWVACDFLQVQKER